MTVKTETTVLNKEDVLEALASDRGLKELHISVIDFTKHRFERAVDFSGATFTGDVVFVGAKFEMAAIFRDASFLGRAVFDGVHFGDKADFARVRFHKEATFTNVEFSGHTGFGAAQFHEIATFTDCHFCGETYFGYADFHEVDFSSSRFDDKVFFDGYVGDRIFLLEYPAWFKGVFFENQRQVRFRGANLNKCSFLDTDISEVNFTDCEWSVQKSILGARRVVYDELSRHERESYGMVEKEYRLLRKNYEERGNYAIAGDFYYGEMEMRRLAQGQIARFFSLTALYKVLSGYGERYWLAITWLLFLFVLFAALYMLIGLRPVGTQMFDAKSFNYQMAFSLSFVTDSMFWQDFYQAFLHSLEVGTLQRTRSTLVQASSGRLIEIAQTLMVAIQAGLTVLAVRRRFKR